MTDESGMLEGAEWVELITYASAFEADYAVETLISRGIPARSQGNDIVGIFGPGFQAPNARGVRVIVQAAHLSYAKEIVQEAFES